MDKIYSRDNWQTQFENWKKRKEKSELKFKESSNQKGALNSIKKDIENIFSIKKDFETNAQSIQKKIEELRKEPKYVKSFKIIIILLSLAIFLFIVYLNFFASHDFNYYYDIGSEKDNFLSPTQRISEKSYKGDITYRNLTSSLVYFNIPIARNSEYFNIDVRFQENLSEKGKFSLGAKDQKDWHYRYNLVYSPTIEKLLEKYPYKEKDGLILIQINDEEPDYDIDDFLNNPSNSPATRISTDQDIKIPSFKLADYKPSYCEINTALRGTQTFYVYIKDNLDLYVEKRDLNWYNNNKTGDDFLEINLYDFDNNLISSKIIEDDKIKEAVSDKNSQDKQTGSMNILNLKEGVYKLQLKNNGDMLITKIKINQNKIILFNEVFLAQSSVYFNNFQKESKIYFKTPKEIQLTARTWHDVSYQTFKVNSQNVNINQVIIPANLTLNFPNNSDDLNLDENNSDDNLNEFNVLTSFKNDIIIQGPRYFSFAKDSWFDPFTSGAIPFKEDISYIENNADFVLVKYTPIKYQENNPSDEDNSNSENNPNNESSWKTASTSFNLDDLYVKDGKLNMLFNTPNLNTINNINQNKNETNMFVSVDYIKINVHKPGLIEKWKKDKNENEKAS